MAEVGGRIGHGGTWIPPEPKPHVCIPPKPHASDVGWRWRCGTCNQVWEVYSGAQYNEVFHAWRKVDHG